MDENIAEELRTALNFLREGKTKEARPILVGILKTNPETQQAWYMLSFVVSDREKQIYALQQVIQLDPNHDKAKSRLAKILASQDDDDVSVESSKTGDTPIKEPDVISEIQQGPPEESSPLERLDSTFDKTPPFREPTVEPGAVASEPVVADGTEDLEPETGEISASTFGTYEGPKRNWKGLIRNIIIGIIILGAGYFIVTRGIDLVTGILDQPDTSPNVVETTETPELSPTITVEGGGRELPPTWTPSPTPPATPTATLTPTPTITETPSS